MNRFAVMAGILAGVFAVSCSSAPPPPPVELPRGGKVQWSGTYGFWDRNGDGRADRVRHYWGSGYAREYFDDDFDGSWDGAEHAPGYRLATGQKENRTPEGLNEQDRRNIGSALECCIPSR
ncbi:MAG: hypothetical protein V4689_13510 [Verrucomicrobiota bacterium]